MLNYTMSTSIDEVSEAHRQLDDQTTGTNGVSAAAIHADVETGVVPHAPADR